jgi:hypothetical protein
LTITAIIRMYVCSRWIQYRMDERWKCREWIIGEKWTVKHRDRGWNRQRNMVCNKCHDQRNSTGNGIIIKMLYRIEINKNVRLDLKKTLILFNVKLFRITFLKSVLKYCRSWPTNERRGGQRLVFRATNQWEKRGQWLGLERPTSDRRWGHRLVFRATN